MSAGFDEVLAGSGGRVRNLAAGTRALIQSVMPDAMEVPWPRQGVIGYGVGQKKMSEHFCYVAVHGDHVNLGVDYGAELPDPEGLLEAASTHRMTLKPSSQEE